MAQISRQRAGPGLDRRQPYQLRGDNRPLSGAGLTRLVANPADIGSPVVEDGGIGLILADQLDIAVKVVFLPAAVGALPAGAVKPYVKNLPILGQQLGELGLVVVVIPVGAVEGAIAVPGGEVEAKFQTASRQA